MFAFVSLQTSAESVVLLLWFVWVFSVSDYQTKQKKKTPPSADLHREPAAPAAPSRV